MPFHIMHQGRLSEEIIFKLKLKEMSQTWKDLGKEFSRNSAHML